METTKSIELIETMFKESKKSFCNNSPYFILWGIALAAAGLAEHLLSGYENNWLVWPIVSTLGGIGSMVLGIREGKNQTVTSLGDRLNSYIWLAFIAVLVYSVVFSLYNHITPHALIMIVTAYATFLTGAISKYKPLMWGSVALAIGAILAAFVFPMSVHGLVFAITITLGYTIPGFMLRRSENV
jgi:hypothetical protein